MIVAVGDTKIEIADAIAAEEHYRVEPRYHFAAIPLAGFAVPRIADGTARLAYILCRIADGLAMQPIEIHQGTRPILIADGAHRWLASKMVGFKYVPVRG